jgi:cob(I)alamin adenosyltransferase
VTLLRKWRSLLCLTALLSMPLASVEAAMVSTDEAIRQQGKSRLIEVLARDDVQQKLMELGVDPSSAKARVNQMTDEEIAELNGQIEMLPAGAGLSTTHLLLIIIIIILLV